MYGQQQKPVKTDFQKQFIQICEREFLLRDVEKIKSMIKGHVSEIF